jgi:membrane-anchored protein YejM (alkaline phosphatase superfamily)
MIYDLIHLFHNPYDYELVYKNSSSDINWKTEYISMGVIIIVICLSTFGLSIRRLYNPQKWVRLLTNVLYILITLTLIISYYRWYLTGFDHP